MPTRGVDAVEPLVRRAFRRPRSCRAYAGVDGSLPQFGELERVHATRARIVLDAHPNDQEICQALIYAREPLGFVGRREPYLRCAREQLSPVGPLQGCASPR